MTCVSTESSKSNSQQVKEHKRKNPALAGSVSGRSEALRQKFPVEFPCVVPVKVRREVHVTGDANGVVTDNVKVHASVTASKCVLCHGSESKEHKRKNPLLSGENAGVKLRNRSWIPQGRT